MLKKLTIIALIMSAIIQIAFSAEKYAVLITGTCTENERAYWCDTFWMWEILTQEKGYDPDNVFVIFNDGTDFYNYQDTPDEWVRYRLYPRYKDCGFGPADQIVDYSATKENIAIVADRLLNEKNIGMYPIFCRHC